jgi:alpha-beta hydrolase superfamily lysophospholipase
VINYALRQRPVVRGVILASAALRNAVAEQRFKVLVAQLLGGWFPRTRIPLGVDLAAGLSRSPSVAQSFRGDPLAHQRITLGLGKCGLAAMTWALDHAGEWQLPVLIMHGTHDRLADPAASETFAAKVRGDCTLKLWPNLWHELHSEPEKDEVFTYALDWIEHRVSGPMTGPA